MTKAIPDGYNTVTPSFTFKDCEKAIEFYKRAFVAEVLDFLPNPSGKGTMHATIKIGNSIVMMGDEMPGNEDCGSSAESIGKSPISFYVYVQDADAAFKKAVAAGGKETMPMSDAFWGDRTGMIKDPFGYSWMIATHKQDLSKDQITQAANAFFAQMAKK